MSEARDALLHRFRWVDGHADVWSVFRDGPALRAVVRGLVDPFRSTHVTAVVGIESRGFLLGGAAAVELGVGFVAVRKAGALFPGEKVVADSAADYRGRRSRLLLQRDAVQPGDRLLLVDDWVETGSQMAAAVRLLAAVDAELMGAAVLVDQRGEHAAADLPRVHSLVRADQLPRVEPVVDTTGLPAS